MFYVDVEDPVIARFYPNGSIIRFENNRIEFGYLKKKLFGYKFVLSDYVPIEILKGIYFSNKEL